VPDFIGAGLFLLVTANPPHAESFASFVVPTRDGSDKPKQHEDDDNDQDCAQGTDAAVPVAIAITAETAAEAAEQQYNDDDDEDRTKHDFTLFLPGEIMPRFNALSFNPS